MMDASRDTRVSPAWGIDVTLSLVMGAMVVGLSAWLRHQAYTSSLHFYSDVQIANGFLAIVFAATSLVHYRVLRDRFSVLIATAFTLFGILVLSSGFLVYFSNGFLQDQSMKAPIEWSVIRLVLSAFLVISLRSSGAPAEEPHNSRRELGYSLLFVILATILFSFLRSIFPVDFPIPTSAILPRPSNLVSGALFLWAAIGFRRRLRQENSPYLRGLFIMSALNVGCQLAVSQSLRQLDAAFTFGQALSLFSFAIALGGSLLDNSRLFDRFHHLATSDSLTGLANYRSFVESAEREIERSSRTNRSFAILLIDLDRLKQINDRFGHPVGSQALRRLANLLRISCRSIDTAARYGGDEFGLVLPETDERSARMVAGRLSERLS
ncbi:MAG: GGDEF domain-containing protein, partial [Candidatus Acidiferrales bacterium]